MPKNKTPKRTFISMGISRSQAEALAEGFLDNLGTDDKSELQPRETFTELFLLAGEFVEDAQDNLNSSNSNASGELSKSLVVTNPTESGNVVSVDVTMNFYGKFVNKGVKGTKSGSSNAGYSFRSEFPSPKMVEALKKGINRARRSTTNVNRRKSTSRNEIKNATISDIDKAFGAGRNIKMYGIKATGFIDKAVVSTARKVQERLGAAFKIDVLNSI